MFGTQGWISAIVTGFFGDAPRRHIDRSSNRLAMAGTLAAIGIAPGNRVVTAGKKDGNTRLLKPQDLANPELFDGQAMVRAMEKEAERNRPHDQICEMAKRIAADWHFSHSCMMSAGPENFESVDDHALMGAAYTLEDNDTADLVKAALGWNSEVSDNRLRTIAANYSFNHIPNHDSVAKRIDAHAHRIDRIVDALDAFEISVDVNLPINATCRLAKRTQLAQAGDFRQAEFEEAPAKAFRATRLIMAGQGVDEFDMRYIQALVMLLMERNEAMKELSAERLGIIIMSIANQVVEARAAQNEEDPRRKQWGHEIETALTACDIGNLKVDEIRSIYRQISETRNVSMVQGIKLAESLEQASRDWEVAWMEPTSHLRLVSSR